MKGLMKAAFDDPNPVVIFEHKGLYWSKVPGTQEAKTPEPDAAYRVPLGKARMALEADSERIALGEAVLVITYGMGVHWALQASKSFPDRVSILDLRTLNPLDEAAIDEEVRRHNRVLILTEETVKHSFAEALAGRISSKYFQWLDAPVQILGSLDTPAIPLSENLEKAMLPNAEKTIEVLKNLLDY
jgi:2-oxoisovalerate dehydrogenase E1 component